MTDEVSKRDRLEFATTLTAAWLSNPNNRAWGPDISDIFNKMCKTVDEAAVPSAPSALESPQTFARAVSVRKSLASQDHIISMIDGKPYRTLLRHLAGHGLTPDQYRHRYGLPPDYPMVSATYSEMRRELAKRSGFGRERSRKVVRKSSRPRGPGESTER